MNFKSDKTDIRGEQYAGSKTCVQCHKDISNSYAHLEHFRTSQPIEKDDFLDQLVKNPKDFYLDPKTKIVIEKRDSGNYQVAYLEGKEVRAHRFDIAFGSGKKGQTYGWWKGKNVYQLPLTYFKAIKGFANSPGFPNYPHFDRAIVSRCFECHSSFVENKMIQTGGLTFTEELNKQAIIYGIDCERCHGPSANHANFHLDNPKEKQAKYIVSYKTLSKQAKMDMCGVCHSGNDLDMRKSTFYFKPGDKLADFYEPTWETQSIPDVHGKQVQMLQSSLCFIKSSNLDCVTCHNSHPKQIKENTLTSQACINCHKEENHNLCKSNQVSKVAKQQNCVNCHMPEKASNAINYQESGIDKTSPYLLRTHKIAIYPEESKKITSWINKTVKNN